MLAGEAATAARSAAVAVATEVGASDEQTQARAGGPDGLGDAGAGLSSGLAGFAVCQAVLARVTGDDASAAGAQASLEAAISTLATTRVPAGLYSGFTGVAWAAELVDALLGTGDGDRNDGIDGALCALLTRQFSEQAPYDLVNGLVGLGVYALARWPREASAESLAAVVGHLERRARRDHDGLYWWTPPSLLTGPMREQHPRGGVDLGLAHGMAGVLPLLGRACALGVAVDTARELLDGAVSWLLQRLVASEAGPTAPGFVEPGEPAELTRTAWCYGDPGVAIALLLTARDTGDAVLDEAGRALALRATARPLPHTGVTDAGLCHGTAGLAHLFNRMYQLTGEERIADAARLWIDRTLAMVSSAAEGTGPAWSGPGLLEGAAGVALALLAAASPDPPAWDQLLLVSAGGPAEVDTR